MLIDIQNQSVNQAWDAVATTKACINPYDESSAAIAVMLTASVIFSFYRVDYRNRLVSSY